MDSEQFRRQLAREAREYLADFRGIIDSLKQVEGWIALGLVVAVIVMTGVWFFTSLGFSPSNSHVSAILWSLGQPSCRPIDNPTGLVILLDLFLMVMMALLTLGNVFAMLERLRRGLPREPRDLIISASVMLVVGIGGIIFMRWAC